jgi:hypothetical protein
MPVLYMFSRSIIDNSKSIIESSRVMLQLLVSFTIVTYDYHIFVAQATGFVFTTILIGLIS